MANRERRKQPRRTGPRIFKSARGWNADFRSVGGGRALLRNPATPGWTPDGKEGEPTESEAVAREWVTDYLRALRAQAERRQLGIGEVSPAARLEQQAQAYLDTRHHEVSRSTWLNDQGALRLLVEWCGPDTPVDAIPSEVLQAHFRERLRQKYAPSSCRTTRAALGAFFTWAGVEPNPAHGVEIRGERSRKKYGWSGAQIEALRAAADAIDAEGGFNVSARRALELGLGVGLREGELFAAEGRHFRPDTHSYRVTAQASVYLRGLQPPKSRDTRTALVLPFYWEHHAWDEPGLLLAGPDGGLVRNGRDRGVIDAVIRRAGLKVEGERNHMLRHTYSRLYLEQYDGDLRKLQKYLGHKSLRTTEDYYGHYSVDVALEQDNARIYPQGKPELVRAG